MKLQERVFPSSERRGGCAIKKMLRSLLMKAQTGWSVPNNVTTSTCTIMTTPSAPLRRFRVFFLLAQPPLLFQEGNTMSWQFIHTFMECCYSCSIRVFRGLLDYLTSVWKVASEKSDSDNNPFIAVRGPLHAGLTIHAVAHRIRSRKCRHPGNARVESQRGFRSGN